MKYLLDTHTIIWFITDDDKLSSSSKQEIENINNTCLISIASLWEMQIKHTLGRLELKTNLTEIFSLINKSLIEILPIIPSHIIENSKLSFHHYDPFDRLIIAQAQFENLSIITKDETFKKYNVKVRW